MADTPPRSRLLPLLLSSAFLLAALPGAPSAQAHGGDTGPTLASCSTAEQGWAHPHGTCEPAIIEGRPISTEIECHASPGARCYILLSSLDGGDWYLIWCRFGGTLKANWAGTPSVVGFNCSVTGVLDQHVRDWTRWESTQWMDGVGAVSVAQAFT